MWVFEKKTRVLLIVLVFLISLPNLMAKTPKFDIPLYGVSYYHEYMPYERLEEDVKMMKKAGINVVRLGESTWGLWEPREGEFEFAWMERIINRFHKAEIKVILGTPTYSIPVWLYRKYPEIQVKKIGQCERTPYGLRQHADITHPAYLYYSERVIRQIVSHFKDNPAVIGYQIDNETTSQGTAGRNVYLSFIDYLKKKFGSADKINKVWGLNYWGQRINDLDELPPRDGILNPGYKLEWERFQRKIVTDFLAWQASIVNEYKRSDQFVTQNFVGGVRTDVDQFEIAKYLDIAAVNPYHIVQDRLTGEEIALSGDLNRSLKQSNYLVTETNAQTIGWDSKWQFPPYDGQIRLNVYAHLASGANMVAYWHWHSLHYGQETYWKGVLSHDLEPNRVYKEVSRVAHELERIGPKLVNLKKTNKVAILYSIDSYQGIKFMPFDDKVDYMAILHQFHRTLYNLNIEVDFVFPPSNNFDDYDLIVVPPLYIASDELLNKLVDYVKKGGNLLLSFKSGFCNEYSTVHWSRMPGPLRKAAGFSYQEFSTLIEPLPLKEDSYKVGDENKVSVWAEFLIPEGAKPLAFYEHPVFEKYPAITRNKFGKGSLTYEGTVLSDKLQEKVMLEILELAGLTGPDQNLPPSIKVKHGVNDAGKALHYYFNFSDEDQTFTYPYKRGLNLLTDKPIKKSQAVTLAPWDLVIIEH